MRPRFAMLACMLISAQSGCSENPPRGGRSGVQEHPAPLVTVKGTGATFASPIFSKWALVYFERTGRKVRYVAKGSAESVPAIKSSAVDFGASDIPLRADLLQLHKLVQFPLIIGGAVVVFNVPGIETNGLKLTAEILDKIYCGRISHWNDPAIKELNPRLALPDREVIPIYRDETSGTARLFASFLSTALQPSTRPSAEEKRIVGVRAKSNAQVADFIHRFKYTIGYVEHAYAKERRLSWARLRNAAGKFVKPGRAAFKSAAEHGTWQTTAGLAATLTGASGGESWPITGVAYILVRATQKSAERARRMLGFFHWALTEGAAVATAAGYVTIPARFIGAIERSWSEQILADGTPVWEAGPAKE